MGPFRLLAMFVQSTLLPCEGWSRGRRRSSPHSGESSDRLFILRFNFCRLGECGAITVMQYEHWLCNLRGSIGRSEIMICAEYLC